MHQGSICAVAHSHAPPRLLVVAALFALAGCREDALVFESSGSETAPLATASAVATHAVERAVDTVNPGSDIRLVDALKGAKPPAGAPAAFRFSSSAAATSLQKGAAARQKGAAAGLTAAGADTLTQTAVLSWDRPSTSADGSALTDLQGFRVYQGNEQQLSIVQEIAESGAGTRRQTQIDNVVPGNNCFAVTAYDRSGNESTLSSVVCRDSAGAPALPTPPAPDSPSLLAAEQLGSDTTGATVRLTWQVPQAAQTVAVSAYNFYRGTQSQLFKVDEVQNAAVSGALQHDLSGIGGDQACFALTALYVNGNESALSAIVCIALGPPPPDAPGAELRPYDISASLEGPDSARISWRKPNTVVSSSDATPVDGYDLYQGSMQQLFKVDQLPETGGAGDRREAGGRSISAGGPCFALTAFDTRGRQSALSDVRCVATGTDVPPPTGSAAGVHGVVAADNGNGRVLVSWDTPTLVAPGQPIGNLRGYNLYQGTPTQLFKIRELGGSAGAGRQSIEISDVTPANDCFALTAFDSAGFETPLSAVDCADLQSSGSAGGGGLRPPGDLSTSGGAGATSVTLNWTASGYSDRGLIDPSVIRYNLYQGDTSRLNKVGEVAEDGSLPAGRSMRFDGVTSATSCFALTAQDNRSNESALSAIVCRDD